MIDFVTCEIFLVNCCDLNEDILFSRIIFS